MVDIDRSEEDMQNLSEAHGKPLKKSNEVLIKPTGSPHKIQNLVNDISDILKKDENNAPNQKAIKDLKKKSHHIKSRDYLGDKKSRIPSAADLMNGPLRDSYQGLEGGPNGGYSYHDFSKLTSKDLSKSVNDNLNMTASAGGKDRKGRRGSVDVKKSSAHIINSTLASTLEIAEPRDKTQKGTLGITGKDLAKATKSSFDNLKVKTEKKKSSKGSIGTAINEPFRQSMEALGITKDTPDKSSVKIKPPKNTDMYVATKEHHRKHEHEKI
jgi:hypothetical protein